MRNHGRRTHTAVILGTRSAKLENSALWARGLAKTEGTKFLDFLPITRITSAFFYNTPREIYGRITQILTGPGYIGDHYARLLPKESP